MDMDSNEPYFADMVAQIMCECSIAGVYPPEYLVIQLVVNAIRNPDNGFVDSQETRAQQVNRLIDLTVEQLVEQKQPYLLLIELQAFIMREYIHSEHALMSWQEIENAAMSPLVDLILLSSNREVLLDRLVVYCILFSSMGDPSDKVTYHETRDVLLSLVTQRDILDILNFINSEKIDLIDQISELTAGIRLFNQARGQGGSTIPDYWSLTTQGIKECVSLVSRIQGIFEKSLKGVLDILLPVYSWDAIFDVLIVEYEKKFTKTKFECAITYLLLLSQTEVWIKVFLTSLNRLETNLAMTLTLQEACYDELVKLSDHRVAIKIDDAKEYLFGLAACRRFFFQSLVIIHAIAKVVQKIKNHIEMLGNEKLEDEEKNNDTSKVSLREMLDTLYVPTPDPSSYLSVVKEKIDPSQVSYPVVFVDNEIDAPGIEFNGYDIVYIIEGKGIALKGDYTLGIIMYEGLGHVFYDVRSAYVYAKDPGLCRRRLIDFCRRHVEYALVVGVISDIRRAKRRGFYVTETPIIPTRDKAVQTDIHPVETFIDKNYMSSCWELKKEAIKLANIVKCRTHSTQTISSSWREGISVQTYDQKDQEVQTMKDEWTNVPFLQNFMKGLRGVQSSYNGLVVLTRPITEQMSHIVPSIPERPC